MDHALLLTLVDIVLSVVLIALIGGIHRYPAFRRERRKWERLQQLITLARGDSLLVDRAFKACATGSFDKRAAKLDDVVRHILAHRRPAARAQTAAPVLPAPAAR